jgi:hypothetical protein
LIEFKEFINKILFLKFHPKYVLQGLIPIKYGSWYNNPRLLEIGKSFDLCHSAPSTCNAIKYFLNSSKKML